MPSGLCVQVLYKGIGKSCTNTKYMQTADTKYMQDTPFPMRVVRALFCIQTLARVSGDFAKKSKTGQNQKHQKQVKVTLKNKNKK